MQMLMDQYSIEQHRKALPQLEELSKEERDKTLFYLGIAAYTNLMTQAAAEIEGRQEVIVSLIHDEVDTQLIIAHAKLKQ